MVGSNDVQVVHTWRIVIVVIVVNVVMTYAETIPIVKQPEPWRVAGISFTGNKTIKKSELRGVMELRPVLFKKKQRFTRKKLTTDVEELTRFYESQGFRSAQIIVDSIRRDSTRKKVYLQLSIEEGMRTTIKKVTFSGWIPDSSVTEKLKCKKDAPLQQSSISHDEQLLKNERKNKGYLYVSIVSQKNIDTVTHRSTINFFVHDGPQVMIDSVYIAGITRLKPVVITREISFKKGDTLTSGVIKKTERKLYRTGLVKSLSIEPAINDSSILKSDSNNLHKEFPVEVSIREANFYKLKIGAGYGSYEGIRGSVETSYSNLFRQGHQLALKGNLSPLIQQIQTVYSTPWFLGIPLRFDGSLYYNRFNDKNTYRGEFRGVQLSLEKPTDYDFTFYFLTKFEDVVWVTYDTTSEMSPGYPELNTQTFGVNILYDTRNNLMDPSKGIYNLFKTELAGIAGIHSNQFVKFTNDFRIYKKIRNYSFASGLEIGWVKPYGKSESVPVQNQFFSGGSKSVRGFKNNFLLVDPDSSNKARSGTVLMAVNLIEFRFPIVWILQGAVFADAGYLSNSIANIDKNTLFDKLRWGVGPGLRLNTPLAVIRIDLGIKLNPLPGEGLTHWHLDVGQSF